LADLASSPAHAKASPWRITATLLIHLRLHFQILLAPIFLWGYLLADGSLTGRFWVAFTAFHLFLYGGTTAFNSYYDRDEGPVGGLVKPPPVFAALLPFSLVIQGIGAVLALSVNAIFAILYLVIFAMGFAYSHPRTRWKGHPFGGLLTVGIGQGILAGLAGWTAANPSLIGLTPLNWLGLLAAALVTVGFYPLTQIYQIDEDLRRGDRTFAAWAGPPGAFRFALVVLSAAAILLVIVIGRRLGVWNALIVASGYSGLLAVIGHWAANFDPANVLANYRRVMRIYLLTTLGFVAFLLFHLQFFHLQ
jgi:4-hydroxybenzoate polyprenyltransferase